MPNDTSKKTIAQRKTRYSISKLISQLGKREQIRVEKTIGEAKTLSKKEINKRLQRANPKDAQGLEALKKWLWQSVMINNQEDVKASLELIQLSKSGEGRKTLYQCLGYIALSPLMKKISDFVVKRSEDTALDEFENALMAKSQTVLELNGRTYIEKEAIQKCLKATPQEVRNLEVISQESYNHNGKTLFPIDGILNTTLVAA